MRKRIKFLSILLSIIITLVSFSSTYFVSYALTPEEFIGETSWKNMSTFQKWSYVVSFVITSAGAVVGGDFASFLQGQDAFVEYMNKDPEEVIDFNENGFVVPADLVALIKQALKEYSEETNGYMILPSIHFSTISPSSFGNSYQYQTAKALVNEYGLVGLYNYSGVIKVFSFSEYLNNTAGFFVKVEYSNRYLLSVEDLLKWSYVSYPDNQIQMNSHFEKVIHSWDEAESSASPSDGLYYYSASDKKSYDNIRIYKPGYAVFDGSTDIKLVSKDGRNILVFKNKQALENYTVDHRTVYFGSKFYEDTGAVTGSYDDLQDWLDGKYDDFFDKLKDLIPEGSNLSEDDLEKLIDKLLGGLDEVGDKIEEGNKETNNLLQQILNALNKLDATVASSLSGSGFDTSGIEAYLARILDDLDYIVYEMEEKTEDELSDDLDNMSDTVMDTFSDLGEVAKTKFPLSIPWDIYNLLTMLGGGSPAPASDDPPESYDTTEFVSISTYSLEEVSTYSGEHGGGGNDHDSGNEDGGGGHSRGGYYLSADGDPVFVLPLIFSESMGLGGTINIDMAQFRALSDISRTLFTLIFAINLVHLTFKAVGLGKDVLE